MSKTCGNFLSGYVKSNTGKVFHESLNYQAYLLHIKQTIDHENLIKLSDFWPKSIEYLTFTWIFSRSSGMSFVIQDINWCSVPWSSLRVHKISNNLECTQEISIIQLYFILFIQEKSFIQLLHHVVHTGEKLYHFVTLSFCTYRR